MLAAIFPSVQRFFIVWLACLYVRERGKVQLHTNKIMPKRHKHGAMGHPAPRIQTPFGLIFLRLRFGPVPPKNGKTGQTLLHWVKAITPITSDLLLLLFSLYLVNASNTRFSTSPPTLTYPMNVSDLHLPVL